MLPITVVVCFQMHLYLALMLHEYDYDPREKKGQAIQMFKIGLHEGIYFLCQTCGEAELQKPQHIGLNLLIAYFYNKDQRVQKKHHEM